MSKYQQEPGSVR